MGNNFEDVMAAVDANMRKAKLGRQTIEDGWLSSNRDALLNMLAFGWPEIGWQFGKAENREALRLALWPLRDHTNRQHIHRLLQETSAKGDDREIRKMRLSLGDAVTQMHSAQSHCSSCMNRCREIDVAMSQATTEQCQILLPEFGKRRLECQAAQDQSRADTDNHNRAEYALVDEESAYAQDQLLLFTAKGKYAFHPLNLANAIAGLPYAIGVPFMGVWQSYARCSKLKAPGWPHYRYEVFKTIESAWKVASSSTHSIIDVFEREIKALPKSTILDHPQLGRRKAENYVRVFLCENWWHLQRAIKRTLETTDDPRPPYFVIASNMDKFISEPKTHADLAVAEGARIRY
jgi:hypothetical protein